MWPFLGGIAALWLLGAVVRLFRRAARRQAAIMAAVLLPRPARAEVSLLAVEPRWTALDDASFARCAAEQH